MPRSQDSVLLTCVLRLLVCDLNVPRRTRGLSGTLNQAKPRVNPTRGFAKVAPQAMTIDGHRKPKGIETGYDGAGQLGFISKARNRKSEALSRLSALNDPTGGKGYR